MQLLTKYFSFIQKLDDKFVKPWKSESTLCWDKSVFYAQINKKIKTR